ncbi:hypothetical protein HDU93_005806 [Gonapodya sp. JEL0774]|nr:hypothetical protein HDU93_005806 [Gonapodya sp. JEL0774]
MDAFLTAYETIRRANGGPAKNVPVVYESDAQVVYVPIAQTYKGYTQLEQLHDVLRRRYFKIEHQESLSRTVDLTASTVVEEISMKISHEDMIEWLVPGVKASGRSVVVNMVTFTTLNPQTLKCVSKRVYWDQAAVLKQLGFLTNLRNNIPVGESFDVGQRYDMSDWCGQDSVTGKDMTAEITSSIPASTASVPVTNGTNIAVPEVGAAPPPQPIAAVSAEAPALVSSPSKTTATEKVEEVQPDVRRPQDPVTGRVPSTKVVAPPGGKDSISLVMELPSAEFSKISAAKSSSGTAAATLHMWSTDSAIPLNQIATEGFPGNVIAESHSASSASSRTAMQELKRKDSLPHLSLSDDTRSELTESLRKFTDGPFSVVEGDRGSIRSPPASLLKLSNGEGDAPEHPAKPVGSREGCDGRGGCGRLECQPLADDDVEMGEDLDGESDSEARVSSTKHAQAHRVPQITFPGQVAQLAGRPASTSSPSSATIQTQSPPVTTALPIDPANLPALASMVASMLTAANGGKPPDPSMLKDILPRLNSTSAPQTQSAPAPVTTIERQQSYHGGPSQFPPTPPNSFQPSGSPPNQILNNHTPHMSPPPLHRSASGPVQMVHFPAQTAYQQQIQAYQQIPVTAYQQVPPQHAHAHTFNLVQPQPISAPVAYQVQVIQTGSGANVNGMAQQNQSGMVQQMAAQQTILAVNPATQPQGQWGMQQGGFVFEQQNNAPPVFQPNNVSDELAALNELMNDNSLQFPPEAPPKDIPPQHYHSHAKSPTAVEDLFSWNASGETGDTDMSTPMLGSKRGRDGQHLSFPGKCFDNCKACQFNSVEQFYLMAAGDVDGNSSDNSSNVNEGIVVTYNQGNSLTNNTGSEMERRATSLTNILQAKHAAGMLVPYDYSASYTRIARRAAATRSSIARQRILSAALFLSEELEPIWQMDLDTLASEEQFERLLLEHDRAFAATGMPAALWRRTGEIVRANREFAGLVGVPLEGLCSGKVTIFELMTEDSEVAYWDKWTGVSADPAQKAVMMSCSLVRGGGSQHAQTGSLECAFSFTIRRDMSDVPSAVVGNFLPARPPPLVRVLFERLKIWGDQIEGVAEDSAGGHGRSKKRNVNRMGSEEKGTGALGMFGLGGTPTSLGGMVDPGKDDFADFLNFE